MRLRGWVLALGILPVAGGCLAYLAGLVAADGWSGLTIGLAFYLTPLTVALAGAVAVARVERVRVVASLALCLATLLLTAVCMAFAIGQPLFSGGDRPSTSCPDHRIYC